MTLSNIKASIVGAAAALLIALAFGTVCGAAEAKGGTYTVYQHGYQVAVARCDAGDELLGGGYESLTRAPRVAAPQVVRGEASYFVIEPLQRVSAVALCRDAS